MWAAGCIVLATPLPMVATRTALVAHTPRFLFFKYMPRQRAGRRPPWAQIASLARPEPWRSASISPRAATKSWAILPARGRRRGRRRPLPTRRSVFAAYKSFRATGKSTL